MNGRDGRLDLLRIFLIVQVLCIHTFCVLDLSLYPQYRTVSLALNTCCHYAVPLFAMLSGMVMHGNDITSLRDFYGRRMRRIFIPLIPYTIFFMLLRVLRDHETVSLVVRDAICGMPYYHLWFAFMIVGVYLVMPLLLRCAREIPAAMGIPVCALIIYVASQSGEGPFLVMPFAAYALIGMYIKQLSRNVRSILLGRLAGLLFVAITIYNANVVVGSGSLSTIGYCSICVMMGSICFMLSYLQLVPAMGDGRVTTSLASLVYGVYLFHPIAKGLATCVIGHLAWFSGHVWLVFPLTVVFSFAAVWMVSRTAFGGFLFGVRKYRR